MQPRRFDVEGHPLDHLPPRLRIEQRSGQIGHRALGIGLLARPAPTAQTVQLDTVTGDSYVTAEQMRVGHRHMQPGALRILDRENLRTLTVNLDLGRSEKAPDAVIDMHHKVAGLKVSGVLNTPATHGRGGRGAAQ